MFRVSITTSDGRRTHRPIILALRRPTTDVIRPGLGLPPKHYDAVLGGRIRRDAARGTPLSWDLVERKAGDA